jgi:hypothetical protein
MHSDTPNTLIEQALKIHQENSKLVRLAALPADVNFCDQWFQAQTSPEFIALFSKINLKTGRDFPRWWTDTYDEYVNVNRISEIKTIFEINIVGSDTLFEFGKDLNYSKYPYDSSKGPNGIDPPVWTKIDINLTTLCQYLYVYYFRTAMRGDRRRYTLFLSSYPPPSTSSSSSSSASSNSVNAQNIIADSIPPKLLDHFSIATPNTPTVDSYTYIKKEVTKFFVRGFTYDRKGKVARFQFLKTNNPNNFNFDDYWASLPGFYSSVNEINNALNFNVNVIVTPPAPSSPVKLFDLGTSAGTNQVDKDEIKNALENLINQIREYEVEELVKSWTKMYGGLGKIFKPLLQTYQITQNIAGGLGALDSGQGRR